MHYIRKALKDYKFLCMFFLASSIILMVIFAPLIANYDPIYQNYEKILQAPNSEYLFGTDYAGRDIFSRVLYGGRISLLIALVVTFFVTIIGITVGLVSGYIGGIFDIVVNRFIDMIMSIPYLVFVIAFVSIFGANLKNLIFAMTVISWTNYARVSCSMTKILKNEDFIIQAKIGGANNFRIIMSYLIPNILPHLLVMSTQDIANNLLILSSLSLLGAGSPPPTPEWGFMLIEGKKYMQTAPWLLLFPGLAIFTCVVIFNLLGDSLRDVLDPKN